MIVDLFAGAGGASCGIRAALGRDPDVAVNHSPTALAIHEANHPDTLHLAADVWEVDPRETAGGKDVELLWASPDCTHHSRAKGGKPKDSGLRSLAWVVRDWARDVRPRVIIVENVAEFLSWGPLDAAGQPIKERRGETFNQWVGALDLLGYRVEWRVLAACDFGAPTSRRRLFIIAAADGAPITWPEPTHGPGLLPYRSAAECIDWSIPVPSIFDRPKPLAEATQRRIAAGLKRFVLDEPNPFVVPVGTPPSPGAPGLIQTGQGERKGQRPRYLDLHAPLGTVVAGGQRHALTVAKLSTFYGTKHEAGQSVSAPLRTITATGNKHALVLAWLAKHYGGVTGVPFDGRPLDTVTATDHHAVCAAEVGGEQPEKVKAWLTAYYGARHEAGQNLLEPMRTVVGADRFGLCTAAERARSITDIGMRMLEPHELLRAQFGRFAADYDMSAATTKAAKVKAIGNSVCPELAEALVRAQFHGAMREAA